jgi:2-C-methyl-D-erythritol 2,4-cyclodiphosphate synthase
MTIRVGQGFDVHRFRAGRAMVLGGFRLPSEVGLDGHSDADVVLHAVTDAVLGAAGEGDIGQHFPPSDVKWKDADSVAFVRHALALASEKGLALVNCDVTVVGERPRIGPHREAIRSALAAALGTSEDRVNVKATTTEGLGWTGRAEGLACLAVVLLAGSDVE